MPEKNFNLDSRPLTMAPDNCLLFGMNDVTKTDEHPGIDKFTEDENHFVAQTSLVRDRIEREQKKAALCAIDLWKNSKEAGSDHPYILKKKIQVKGLRQIEGTLLVPAYGDFNAIPERPISLQLIKPDGTKRFLKDGKVQGNFCVIGMPETSDTIYVTEGFATGATVHEATGLPVVVAFSTGNLMEVCQKVKTRFPEKPIIIATDNDLETESKTGQNPGVSAAESVAKKLSIEYVVCPVDSDFNDLLCQYPEKEQGLYAVKEAVKQTQSADIYQKVLCECNRKYAAVMLGGKCQVIVESYDPSLKRPFTNFWSIHEIKRFHENKTLPDPDKPKNKIGIIDYWWRSPSRKSYDGVVFSPGKDIPNYYNLWKGFKVREKQGDWTLFREHIQNVIADGDDAIFQWVIAWMARIIQDPGGERPGTSIVLRGEQGTGKGTFVDYFGQLFGLHYLGIAHASQVVGRFNHHLKDKVLVFVDEGFWAGDKQAEGIIKNLVTEPTLTIEQKGKDIVSVKNNVNLIIASNSDWVVPAGPKERRFMVVDVPNHVIQNRTYFRQLREEMEHGGLEAMLFDLKRWDYSDVDLGTIPRTKALSEQQYNSLDNVEKFWFERLNEGALSIEQTDWNAMMPVDEFYTAYREFAENMRDRHPASKETLAKTIMKLCPAVDKGRPTINGRRTWVYNFPELEQCREAFEKATGMKDLWDIVE